MLWIPVLLLVILPGWWLARRYGFLEKTRNMWIAVLASVALCAASMPGQGVDFEQLKHVNMLLAASATLLFVVHRWRPLTSRRLDLSLLLLAILSVVNYSNYFAFHGERVFVHLHDVAHYYLGSKYYDELGYGDLYTAMLRAEAENHDNRFKALEARDLTTYKRVHVRELLRRSDPVKARFSAQRWLQFRLDAEYFREGLGPHYGKVLLDHGFNPTPVWALGGGLLTRQVPAGSARGILWLTLLDPFLLALTFTCVLWAFGRQAALLAIFFFCIVFGSTFGWVGGAFLRYPWFFSVVCAFCCLKKRKYGLAGALLAVATMVRVFPIFFLAPLAAKAGLTLWRRLPNGSDPKSTSNPRSWVRALPGRYLRLGTAFSGICLALFLATLTLPRGFDHWLEFRTNMQLHVRNIAPNVVGTTEILAHRWTSDALVTEQEFEVLKTRRHRIHQVQQILLFLPLCAWAAWTARRRSDLAAFLLACPLLLTGLSLAAYYYAFMALLVIHFRRDPGRLAAIFATETASYALRLFEPSDGRLFVYRSIAVAWLYLYLWLGDRSETRS